MKDPTVAFEWQHLPEGEELPPITSPDRTPRVSRPGPERCLVWAVVFLLAGVLSLQWATGEAQREPAQAHDELAVAVEVEIRHPGGGDPPGTAAGGDDVPITHNVEFATYQSTLPPFEVARRANSRFTDPAPSGSNQEEIFRLKSKHCSEVWR